MRYAADLGNLLLYLAPETARLTDEQRSFALAEAIPFRPRGIPEARADKAQCLYAAWQLSFSTASNGDGSTLSPSIATATRLKEGDVQVDYASTGAKAVSAAASGNYKARYDELKRLSGMCQPVTRFGIAVPARKARLTTTCLGSCVL